jgi:FtsP/CotA-like multicopper oxidase with cupredoxin domain
MHTHGLWISPTGNSDNVLLRIQPGVKFEYEYNVPPDHPAGTFWYHPHTHGSTAMQVGSGMAGALLIQGDREPTPTSNGDLDTLLRPFQPPGGIKNEVKLFQQIPYACFKRDANGQLQIQTEADGTWKCEAGQIGVVEDFNQQMGPGTWAQSGRHTLINGFARNPAQPLVLEAGKVHRWRLIDAGVREPISLRINKIVNTAGMENAKYATRVQRNAEAQRLCNDPKAKQVSQFEVAADGLTRATVFEKTVNTLQPGYRSDILFALPERGYYCVFSDPTVIDQTKPEAISERNANVLTIIKAVGNQTISDQKSFIQSELIRTAKLLKNKQASLQVQADLRKGLQLTKFVPHPTVTDQEIKASNLKPIKVVLGINTAPKNSSNFLFQVNNKSYDPKDVDSRFRLILGKAQEWVLRAENSIPFKVQHPFHIHVNPFQIVKIINDKTGSEIDVSDPQYSQYKGMKGTWKDTIMLTPGLTIHTRTRYQRYIGEYVLHCHILDHEDQGMMANVEVVLPDGQGGAQTHGHH